MFLTNVRKARGVLTVLTAGLVALTASRLGATEQAGPGAKKEAPAPAAQARDEAALKKALVEEARRVYELDMVRLKNLGNVQAEDVYRWSRRLLEAQRDLAANPKERLAALHGHRERMQELERLTKTLWQTGQGRESDAVAGRYCRAQAELWLAREPKK